MREELEAAISSNETRSEIHQVLMSAATKLWVAVWDSCSLQVTLRGSESFELLHAKDCADSMSDQITHRATTNEVAAEDETDDANTTQQVTVDKDIYESETI